MEMPIAIANFALFDLPKSISSYNNFTIINKGFAFLVSSTNDKKEACTPALELGKWLYSITKVSASQWTRKENGRRESTYRLAQCIGSLTSADLATFKTNLRALFEKEDDIVILDDEVLRQFMIGFRNGYNRQYQRNNWSLTYDYDSQTDKLDEAICAAQICIELGLKDHCVMKMTENMGYGLFANSKLTCKEFPRETSFIAATTLPGNVRRTKVSIGGNLNLLGDKFGIQYPVMAINSINHDCLDMRRNSTVFTEYVHRNTIQRKHEEIDSERIVGQKQKRRSVRLAEKYKYEIHNDGGILVSSACLDRDIDDTDQVLWDYPFEV